MKKFDKCPYQLFFQEFFQQKKNKSFLGNDFLYFFLNANFVNLLLYTRCFLF